MAHFKVQNNLLYKLKSHYLQLNDNDIPPDVPERSGSAVWECCGRRQDGAGRYRPALMWPWWMGAVTFGFRVDVVSMCSSLPLSLSLFFSLSQFLYAWVSPWLGFIHAVIMTGGTVAFARLGHLSRKSESFTGSLRSHTRPFFILLFTIMVWSIILSASSGQLTQNSHTTGSYLYKNNGTNKTEKNVKFEVKQNNKYSISHRCNADRNKPTERKIPQSRSTGKVTHKISAVQI